MTQPRSNLHIVTGHDGGVWLDDSLVEGDFGQKVTELLGGLPEHHRHLGVGFGQAFYRGTRTALVMTFGHEVTRERAEEIVQEVRSGRDDTN